MSRLYASMIPSTYIVEDDEPPLIVQQDSRGTVCRLILAVVKYLWQTHNWGHTNIEHTAVLVGVA